MCAFDLPSSPAPGRYWEMVERLKITHFYTAPTAIRLLIKYGDDWVTKYNRSTLRILGCGKETLVFLWYCTLVSLSTISLYYILGAYVCIRQSARIATASNKLTLKRPICFSVPLLAILYDDCAWLKVCTHVDFIIQCTYSGQCYRYALITLHVCPIVQLVSR